MNDMVLETYDLEKRYGKFIAVDNLSLKIRKRSIYGLVGENGAGKSSLMKMLSGLSNKTKGEIKLLGEDVTRHSAEFMQVGNLIEAPCLYDNLNAYENLKLKSLAYGIKDENKILSILQTVGLYDQNNKNVKSFSLGMKQRLAIAMAMVNSPKLLILDEPINGLDPQGIIDIRKTLQDINKKYGTTIIISSHILDELARLATDFGIISHGKLIAEFSSKDLHDRCQSKIEITCNDVKKASYILRKNAYQNEIISNNKLILIDYFNKTHLINSLLVNNSIDVYSIYLTEMSFEDYYMEVIQNEKSN